MATGCFHSTYACKEYMRVVREFRRKWKPAFYADLGDTIDFTAIRGGAKGSKDEAVPIDTDLKSGLDWIREIKPDVWFRGNHCLRPYELLGHPSAIMAELAGYVTRDMDRVADEVKCKVIPYDIETGWYPLGNALLGHGYMYNINALRDHVEMLGANVIMAHLHNAHEFRGRNRGGHWGVCVGLGGDPRKMHYARRRRQTLTWNHGIAYGEYCDTETTVQMYQWNCNHGEREECRFPL